MDLTSCSLDILGPIGSPRIDVHLFNCNIGMPFGSFCSIGATAIRTHLSGGFRLRSLYRQTLRYCIVSL